MHYALFHDARTQRKFMRKFHNRAVFENWQEKMLPVLSLVRDWDIRPSSREVRVLKGWLKDKEAT